jgi:hypothetical protein
MKKIIKVMFVALLLPTLLFLYACDPEEVLPVDIEYGNFEKDFSDTTFSVTPIDSAIALGADKLTAMEHLLTVIDTNLENADHYASFSDGSGEAFTGGMGGTMTVRSMFIKNDSSFYYEIAGRLIECEPAVGKDAAQIMLNQCRREGSSDMVTFYLQEPGNAGSPTLIDAFPGFTNTFPSNTDVESFDEEGYMTDRNIKERVGEFTNFTFSRDTVLESSVNITHDDEFGFYTLQFSLNLDDTAARDLATDFPRKSLRTVAQSDDIEYSVYDMTIEVWDSGLIRKLNSEESWSGSITVLWFTLEGSSHSLNTVYYSWDPEDCVLSQYGYNYDWCN